MKNILENKKILLAQAHRSLFILGSILVTVATNQISGFASNQIIENPENQLINNSYKSNKSAIKLRLLHTISDDLNGINQLKISNNIIFAADSNGVIKLFNLQNGKFIKSFNINRRLNSLAITPDNQFMVYSLQDTNIIRIVKLTNGQTINTIKTRHNVENIAIYPNGKTIIGTDKNGVYRWDLKSGIRIITFPQSNLIDLMAISPNGKILVGVGKNTNISGYNSFVKIWDLNTGRILRTITPKSNLFIKSLDINYDSSKIALGWAGSDHVNALNIWDIRSGKLIKDIGINSQPLFHVPEINCVVFNSDDKYLFTGTSSNDESNIIPITLWNITANNIAGDFDAHQSAIFSLSLSSNRKFLVSSGGDNTIKVWQVESK